jgi:hypothetical protein
MNGFLVLLCHTMDDLPIRFCMDRDEAIHIAHSAGEMPTPVIRTVFKSDASTPVCVKIVTFIEGLPTACEVVKHFD